MIWGFSNKSSALVTTGDLGLVIGVCVVIGIWYSTELGGYSKPLCLACVLQAEAELLVEPVFPAELVEGNYECCVRCQSNDWELQK